MSTNVYIASEYVNQLHFMTKSSREMLETLDEELEFTKKVVEGLHDRICIAHERLGLTSENVNALCVEVAHSLQPRMVNALLNDPYFMSVPLPFFARRAFVKPLQDQGAILRLAHDASVVGMKEGKWEIRVNRLRRVMKRVNLLKKYVYRAYFDKKVLRRVLWQLKARLLLEGMAIQDLEEDTKLIQEDLDSDNDANEN